MTANPKRCWGAFSVVAALALVGPAGAAAQGALGSPAMPESNAIDLLLLNGVVSAEMVTRSTALPTIPAGPIDENGSPGGSERRPGEAVAGAEARSARTTFRDVQLRFPRVRRAHSARAARVEARFEAQGVTEPAEVFFRVFKRERLLEVWARDAGSPAFVMINTYPVCGMSGELGPKREEGDKQIPEGFYHIDVFNPVSNFHLSLRLDYPNQVDQARAGTAHPPGGDIFIHGGCSTIGCVPVTDEWIEEIYLMAMSGRDAGQARIPVHMFPTHLDDSGMGWLRDTYGEDHPDLAFWQSLREGYLAFETTRLVPVVDHHRGRYTFPKGVAAQP
jgi:murein L,D-transpeptidase YafK